MNNFKDILRKGLDNGELTSKEISEIDFKNDNDVFDYFEALDELIDRGIKINYSKN